MAEEANQITHDKADTLRSDSKKDECKENKYDKEQNEKQNETEAKKPTSYDKCPPIQLIVRDNKGWQMYNQDTKTGKLHNISGDSKPCSDANITFSNDGKYFAVLLDNTVEIYKSSKCRFIISFRHDRVRKVYFSPLNKFIITYHHRRKEDKSGNCWVTKWNKSECIFIHQFFMEEFNDKSLPFSLSNDEFIAAQITKNKLLIYDMKQLKSSQNGTGIIFTLDVAKIVSAVIAPCHINKKQAQNTYILGVFAMATTTKGATVTIYEYKHNKKECNQISQRQFFGIDECTFLWDSLTSNSYHHNVLVIVSSNIDTFGQSYYGNQQLLLMSSQNKKSIQIEITNKFQDVQWHPCRKEFVLIDDNPQKICIFDDKGNKVHSIGQYARNIIKFSKCGKFLWVGGFGNLTGEMTFYDYENIRHIADMDKNKQGVQYLQGYNKESTSACRYFEWSADSSLFVIASIYPYMSVDNGFRVYKYNGYKLYQHKVDRLYQVAYRPSLNNVYPHKDVSVKALNQSQALPAKETIAKTKYVPPHLRNKGNKRNAKTTKRYFG